MSSRAVSRTRFATPLTGEVTVFQPIVVCDLSECGLQIETSVALQNDSLHEFRIVLGDRSVVLKGRVVYCQVGRLDDGAVTYRAGIEFVEPSPHALAALHDFLGGQHASTPAAPPRVVDAEVE